MQNRDGGWAAFDRDINREVLTKVPFADHNAMLDPSCPDITGPRAGGAGPLRLPRRPSAGGPGHRVHRRRRRSRRGCWFGRWGVNYIYGTWQVLVGLRSDRLRHAAARWCGGRSPGSSRCSSPAAAGARRCRSYDDPALAGQGTPTASQTAWALLGLLAAGEARQRRGPRRHRLPAGDAAGRRQLARGAVHRHRLPEGVLPEISHVSASISR